MALTLTPKSDMKSQRHHKQAEYTSSCKHEQEHEQEQEPPWSQLTGICSNAPQIRGVLVFTRRAERRGEEKIETRIYTTDKRK